MDKERRKNALIKYARKSLALMVAGIIFIAFTVILSVCFIVAGAFSKELIIAAGVMLLMGGLLMAVYFVSLSKLNKNIAKIEMNNGLEILLNDFENAGRAFNDRVVLGDVFIIGKNTGVIVSYGEITRIYQYIHSTNGVEDTRMLKANLAEGRTVDLCALQLRGKSDDELNQVCAYICSKNPDVRVGYKT